MSCDFMALATPGVQGLHPYEAGKPVEELERELGISNIIKLASNENPLGPSAMAMAAVESALSESTRYPDSNGFGLKRALRQYYGLAADQLTLGNGSNDVLELITRAFLNPDDEVVFSEYAFAVYPILTQACSAKAVITPARDYGHNLQAMAEAISDKTRLLFIANPNNPTGTALMREELVAFLDSVPQTVIVVLDEAYTEYVESADFPDGLELLPQYPNLIVTRTFSKAWGLAGLRVGFAAANPEITDLLNRVRQPFNVSHLALAAAEAVLSDHDYLKRSVDLNRDGMQQLEEGLKLQGLGFIPSYGNFVTVDVARPAQPVFEALLHEGVIVRPLAPYRMPQHLRISIGLPEENDRFLRALRQVLAC
ncbi:histidinol-phosphate transaminase [Marinobacterium sediminicola]|uniref:Histidinol-phosphate aminotransferase n=1 Tax=Marinobacterium sediminicola TaxID=518898 RepID=A0ABY1S086_9GAMM|nr:histidinol-phosphate transaminase [Marinobacterium sediminicola]ULG70031.1 histidinol-phosphate transaminase [Marinobacterium sediminicola]SMR74485.1 histidinol-phosphate aminotransferase [Marinobacterium sediminicola]